MQSKTRHHYPLFVFREGIRHLWNPVLKKAFKNRPEERVRMKLVEYLIHEADFSSRRLSFESPVKLPGDRSSSRTDLIAYDPSFKPLLLAECKSPDVILDENAAQQIARYNREISAPYLLITNGNQDFWFEVRDDQLSVCTGVPGSFDSTNSPNKDLPYWMDRAFIGSHVPDELHSWFLQSCEFLYADDAVPIYLSFDDTDPELGLMNYYRIIEADDKTRLAISLTATSIGATRMNVILNQRGQNSALLSASLNLLNEKEQGNTVLHSAKGLSQTDLLKEGFSIEVPLQDQLPLLNKLLLKQADPS